MARPPTQKSPCLQEMEVTSSRRCRTAKSLSVDGWCWNQAGLLMALSRGLCGDCQVKRCRLCRAMTTPRIRRPGQGQQGRVMTSTCCMGCTKVAKSVSEYRLRALCCYSCISEGQGRYLGDGGEGGARGGVCVEGRPSEASQRHTQWQTRGLPVAYSEAYPVANLIFLII